MFERDASTQLVGMDVEDDVLGLRMWGAARLESWELKILIGN